MFVDSQAYERFMGRWSRRLAPLVVEFAGVQDGDAVLDVGCGTGALTAAIRAADPSGEVIGVDPVAAFVEMARTAVPTARFEVGDAQSVPLDDDRVDRVLASLVLNFVPDIGTALREMQRVARPGGAVVATLWEYDGGMQMLTRFQDVVDALFPDVDYPDERGAALCHAGRLGALWAEHGLLDVTEEPLVIACEFASFADYWEPFLGGVGPAGDFVGALSSEQRDRLAAALRSELCPDGDGPFTLPARALAVRGRVAA